MKNLILFCTAVLILTGSCQKSPRSTNENPDYPHYNLSLLIDPISRMIQVEGEKIAGWFKELFKTG